MFGQYSSMGGIDRSKRDMLAWAEGLGLGAIVESRKAGKNRLHFTTADGRQHFSLHETVIASLSADRRALTLDTGGWPTMTTRRAMGEAWRAFGFSGWLSVGGSNGANCVAMGSWDRASRFDTAITLDTTTGAPIDKAPDTPLLRAMVEGTEQGSTVVEYRNGILRGEAFDSFTVSAFTLIRAMHKIDAMIKRNHGKITFRGYALDSDTVDVFGFSAHCGQTSRILCIGCHTFRTADFRAVMRRIEGEHPDALAKVKAVERSARKTAATKAA